MPDITFVRELDGTYLLIKSTEPGEDFAERMIETARPPHLLPLRTTVRGEGREYRYEISGMRSLSKCLATREIGADEIRELFRAIYRASSELEDHLLDPGGLWLEPGLMFRGDTGWQFCCLPGRREDIYRQLQPLSRYVLKKAGHEDEDAAALAFELFRLCHEDNVSFTQLLEALEPPAQTEESTPDDDGPLLRRWFRRKK